MERLYQKIDRRKSNTIKVGKVSVGGNSPISVQTMTNTITSDIKSTTFCVSVFKKRKGK